MTSSHSVEQRRDGVVYGVVNPESLHTLSLSSFSSLLLEALEVSQSEDVQTPPTQHLRYLLGLDTASTVILPSNLTNELLTLLASDDRLSCGILNQICKSNVGCITRLNLHDAFCPIDVNTMSEVLLHPLLELSIDVGELRDTDWENGLAKIEHSPAYSTLQNLTLRYGDVGCVWSLKWLKRFKHLVRLDLQAAYDNAFSQSWIYAIKDDVLNLNVLDISYSSFRYLSIKDIPNLKALSMAGGVLSSRPNLISDLSTLKTLVSLDISCFTPPHSNASNDSKTIKMLATLPHLRYLDVSGRCVTSKEIMLFDPPHHRMSFMGLLGTQACTRQEINSDVVSGDANEKQLLISLQTYYKRQRIIEHALDSLFTFAESGHIRHLHTEIVQALLPIFEGREVYNSILLYASACLWHLTKNEYMEHLSTYTKKCVVAVLLKLMEGHISDGILDDGVLKNCLLCLTHFLFPEDVQFVYSRMVKVLVGLLFNPSSKALSQSVLVSLMNSIVWQVSLEQKLQMKTCGGIQASLRYIKEKIAHGQCDQSLEAAWSFLWNVTDETPENGSELLDHNGIPHLINCYKTFNNKEGFEHILKNMLGALGNVAEVPHLRVRIMDPNLLDVFSSILLSVKDMEVQYNVSGIIVNLAMESSLTWPPDLGSVKNYLLELVVDSIQNWDLTKSRDIQYRSLKPILAVAESNDDKVALWGVWALANLCQVYSTKYLPMFAQDGGHRIVEDLLNRTELPQVKDLAHKVLSITGTSSVKRPRLDSEGDLTEQSQTT